jgi:membrane associated rhomboid family serine protease
MFPIRDTIRSRSFPIVNWVIIIINVFVFFIQTNLSAGGLESFIDNFALIPAQIDLNQPLSLFPFFSHMWLHGSLFHIISNMWMLIIFGDNVEDRMGSVRYLVFYVLGGIAAGALQYIFTVNPNLPAVGASGAIAAVMGAYFLFFPRSRVVTFVPIFLFGWFVNIPSFIFLGIWFGTQLLSGVIELTTMAGTNMGGVAWWAHIGGFAFGLLMANLFAAGRKPRRQFSDEYYPW